MKFNFKFIVSLLGFILALGLFCSEQALALQIKGMRAYSNNDKTRIVIDLDRRPAYATAKQNQGGIFIVRIKSLNDPESSPQGVKLSKKSTVSKVERKIENKDVRYIFYSDSRADPTVFVLNPQGKNTDYRLVMDFPHAAAAPESKTSNKESNYSETKPAQNESNSSLASQERELFMLYSTEGKDGIRTMNRQQAKEYDLKLKELRARYARQQKRDVQAEKENKASADSSHRAAAGSADTTASPPEPQEAVVPVARPFVIALDPGHGGKDPGAIGKSGVKEKKVTLAIAQDLARYIRSNKQFKVVMTRNSDRFIELNQRSEIARRNKADVLISIHADSVASNSSSARGASVWVLSNNRAERENGKILRDNKQKKLIGGAGDVISSDPSNPYLAATILDMSSSSSRSDGYLLADEILDSLGKFTHLRKTSPIHASLAVLKAPDIPSLLIETGYLSNRAEEKQLSQPNYQKQIAYRIYEGILSYYKKYPAKRIQSRWESEMRSKSGGKTITVKKGDSLSKIAKQYGSSVSAIKKANSLKSDVVHVGQSLYIPK
ncbi:MAG TPA: hypothetical protein DCR21_06895 [Succinivibrionaceae bacterium]|nr:hypothetical protein [Succinivibrionaceae bacterium]